jgi:hypothetical protein
MSFRLPPVDHPAREAMGDVATIAAILDPRDAHLLRTTWQARRDALNAFEADTSGAMSRINFVVIRADSDERWLISVGRRGGWRKLWNFGTGRD